MSKLTIKTKIALVAAIVLWASAFVGIRAGLESYTPGPLALLRFLVASLCMGIVYWRLPQRAEFKRKDIWLLLLFGAIGLGLYNVTLNYGELTIPSGIASFIVSQSPLLTLIFATIFLHEKFNFYSLLGILVSIVGVGLISLGESDHYKFDIGILYILISTFLSGIYSVMQKPFLKKYQALDVTVFIIWGCTLSLLVYLPSLWQELPHASLHATFSVIYLGIFPAAIAYFAWSYALTRMPASQAVSYLYFMPIVATILGWLWLGEVPVLLSFIGGLVALFGVWVANLKR